MKKIGAFQDLENRVSKLESILGPEQNEPTPKPEEPVDDDNENENGDDDEILPWDHLRGAKC